MTVAVIIPARYNSTRFPGKPLCLLNGIPLIQHVYLNSRGAQRASEVLVATDSELIYDEVQKFGGRAVMTDAKHPSGTDRIAEVAALTDYDIIVNVQGDEPLIRPEMIDDVISILDDGRASIGTLVKRTDDPQEIADPNIVKAVFDREKFALYFSRAPVPYYRDEWQSLADAGIRKAATGEGVYKHIGVYSYRREALLSLSKMPESRLERIEKLEQLRAIENGLKIKVKETVFATRGIDVPEDVEKVMKCLNTSS
jgi:3-deoxy-manno-octulosonate cytidylyltransferase (CMP-KDO synthetase)